MSYLKIRYSEKNRPFTSYPEKLVNYLVDEYQLKAGMKLYEPGVGRGEFLIIFKDAGLKVFGSDIEKDAKEFNADIDVEIVNLDTDKSYHKDCSFDVIYSKSFLEHLNNPSFFLKEAHRLLKPGGKLITLTPDWDSQYKNFFDDYTHIRPFTLKSLEEIQISSGFKNLSVRKFKQLPSSWDNNMLDRTYDLISLFVKHRSKDNFFRWTKEKMLLSISEK
jgi:SAM-dependent methyltransferase